MNSSKMWKCTNPECEFYKSYDLYRGFSRILYTTNQTHGLAAHYLDELIQIFDNILQLDDRFINRDAAENFYSYLFDLKKERKFLYSLNLRLFH